jgi:hypothetical protein
VAPASTPEAAVSKSGANATPPGQTPLRFVGGNSPTTASERRYSSRSRPPKIDGNPSFTRANTGPPMFTGATFARREPFA